MPSPLRCPDCGYQLWIAPHGTCPECGFPYDEDTRIFSLYQFPWWIPIAALFLTSSTFQIIDLLSHAQRFGEQTTPRVLLAGAMGIGVTAFVIARRRARWAAYVALTPIGIRIRRWGGVVHIRWTEIEDIRLAWNGLRVRRAGRWIRMGGDGAIGNRVALLYFVHEVRARLLSSG